MNVAIIIVFPHGYLVIICKLVNDLLSHVLYNLTSSFCLYLPGNPGTGVVVGHGVVGGLGVVGGVVITGGVGIVGLGVGVA